MDDLDIYLEIETKESGDIKVIWIKNVAPLKTIKADGNWPDKDRDMWSYDSFCGWYNKIETSRGNLPCIFLKLRD